MYNPIRRFSQYLNTRKLHAVPLAAEDSIKVYVKHGATEFDITDCHALISLKPFAIALNAASIKFCDAGSVSLVVMDGTAVLGSLPLKSLRFKEADQVVLYIYESGLPAYPGSFLFRVWNTLLLFLKNISNRKSKNFIVPPSELLKLFVFSLKPRPVYLITIMHANGFDAFPLDLAGRLDEHHFVFSIRSSSAAIPHLSESKMICASLIPFMRRADVYSLGHHHPGGVLPEGLLPDDFTASMHWMIPVPSYALQVMELMLVFSFVKGVHTTFVFKVEYSYPVAEGPALAHTPWFNHAYFRNSSKLKSESTC